jgi:hypothetical protein
VTLNLSILFPAEREALLEALRRDLRSQSKLALRGSTWKIWHQRNVQMNLRVLEALNPKRRSFEEQERIASLTKPTSADKEETAGSTSVCTQ